MPHHEGSLKTPQPNLHNRALAGAFSQWETDCRQGKRCRYKDAKFSTPESGRFSVAWDWTRHTKFEPPNLQKSLCKYTPDPQADHISLENRNLRLRATYPEPAQGTDVDDDSWYASDGYYSVWSGYLSSEDLFFSDQS